MKKVKLLKMKKENEPKNGTHVNDNIFVNFDIQIVYNYFFFVLYYIKLIIISA